MTLAIPILMVAVSTTLPSVLFFPLFITCVCVTLRWGFRLLSTQREINRWLMWTASFTTIIVFSFYVVQLPIFQNATWARKVGLVQFHRVDYDQKVGLLLLGLAMCIYVKVAAYSIRFERALWYAGLRRTWCSITYSEYSFVSHTQPITLSCLTFSYPSSVIIPLECYSRTQVRTTG